MPTARPHRRHLLAALGLTAGVGLVTRDGLDTSAAELENAHTELARIAAAWESTPPTTAVTKLYALHHRAQVVGGRRGDWTRLRGQILVMEAEALTSAGRPQEAIASAVDAMTVSRAAGDDVTYAHAEVVAAGIGAAVSPNGRVPLATVQRARHRAGRSHVAAIAAVQEADILALAGRPASEVLDAVRAAEGIDLPTAPTGFALTGWSSGYVASFSAAALVRAGLPGEAGPRLYDAVAVFGPPTAGADPVAPGALSATLLYQSSAALHAGALDEAAVYAGQALDVSAGCPSAWLGQGVLTLAQGARARGERWPELRARARAAMPVAV